MSYVMSYEGVISHYCEQRDEHCFGNMEATSGTGACACVHSKSREMDYKHSYHVTCRKRVYTLTCHTTMHRNSINSLYKPGHVTL